MLVIRYNVTLAWRMCVSMSVVCVVTFSKISKPNKSTESNETKGNRNDSSISRNPFDLRQTTASCNGKEGVNENPFFSWKFYDFHSTTKSKLQNQWSKLQEKKPSIRTFDAISRNSIILNENEQMHSTTSTL